MASGCVPCVYMYRSDAGDICPALRVGVTSGCVLCVYMYRSDAGDDPLRSQLDGLVTAYSVAAYGLVAALCKCVCTGQMQETHALCLELE